MIDTSRFRAALHEVHPGKLSVADAETIVALLQMSIDADGREDADEIQMFFALGKAVYDLAGSTETPSPNFADDTEEGDRTGALVAQLSTESSRELAYAVAHLMTIIDMQIAPAEEAFLRRLRGALAIPDERANELAAKLGDAITPAE